MRTLRLILLAAALCLSLASLAPAIEFSSDVVVTTAGQKQHTSKVYVKDTTKMRMESPMQRGYSIIRMDRNVMWTVLPEQKSYMESQFDMTKVPRTEEKIQGEVERKLLGSETIDGHPTKKYEVTYKDKELNSKMYQWMATDLNFPIKTAGIDGQWMVEYKNIKTERQADSLFEVPDGYKKMDMPNLGNILSGALKEERSPAATAAEPVAAAPPEKSAEPTAESKSGLGDALIKKLPKMNLPKLPKW